MKITETKVLSLEISDVERLDPIRVMAENYEPGKGRITITHWGEAWTGSWFAMCGRTVQQFFIDCGNDYLIDKMAHDVHQSIDDDNDANMEFVKKEICKLRRDWEISKSDAKDIWDKIQHVDDVKEYICSMGISTAPIGLFGDDPWYARWPQVPNPKYSKLCRIFDAVREALRMYDAQEEAKP